MSNRPTVSHDHAAQAPLGILLTNLGTPDAPTTSALRRYLAEFLWDPRVVDVPRPLWWLILHGIILRTRPARSAAAYRKVWQADGSPLLTISRAQQAGLQAALDAQLDWPVKVALGMRYGNPSIAAGLGELRAAGARRILVLPLYPQYSDATTASTFDAVAAELKGWRGLPELRLLNHYHDHPDYIRALAASIREQWAESGRPQKLLFSFHGTPERYLHEGDPYFCECHKTARLTAEALGLESDAWQVSFQSRFGREVWLQPYTDEILKALPGQGVEHVDVVCPGFSADCLETIEEIGEENRDYFLAAGGERFHYIPALNARSDHIAALASIVRRELCGWPELDAASGEVVAAEGAARRARAVALGAKGYIQTT